MKVPSNRFRQGVAAATLATVSVLGASSAAAAADSFAPAPTSAPGADVQADLERAGASLTTVASEDIKLRVMSFNIKHGQYASLKEIAARIDRVNPDIVALQEVDRSRNRTGNVHQARRLGKLTGMRHRFGRQLRIDGGAYGVALLSEHPIVSTKVVRLPTFKGNEPRVLLKVVVNVKGNLITIGATHLTHRQPEERRLQMRKALDSLPETGPVFLLGDFNAGTGSRPYDQAIREGYTETSRRVGIGNLNTVPVHDPQVRIDHIFEQGRGRSVKSWVVPAPGLSDHLPIVSVIDTNLEPK